jgi:hypothetical protein
MKRLGIAGIVAALLMAGDAVRAESLPGDKLRVAQAGKSIALKKKPNSTKTGRVGILVAGEFPQGRNPNTGGMFPPVVSYEYEIVDGADQSTATQEMLDQCAKGWPGRGWHRVSYDCEVVHTWTKGCVWFAVTKSSQTGIGWGPSQEQAKDICESKSGQECRVGSKPVCITQ